MNKASDHLLTEGLVGETVDPELLVLNFESGEQIMRLHERLLPWVQNSYDVSVTLLSSSIQYAVRSAAYLTAGAS